jgi:hypothetical protein
MAMEGLPVVREVENRKRSPMLTGRAEGELLVIAAYIIIAGVNTMPKPGAKFELYPWVYDWMHVLLNSPMVTRFERKMDIAPNGAVSTDTKVTSTGGASDPKPAEAK